MIHKLTLSAIACAAVITAAAQQPVMSSSLREVTVTGRRPMKDIGVTKTVFDSLALRDNLANSMADVLAYNSSVFVKSYGRATLSTVAFRGTSPSHTQVSWNGMKINSPMLGMTDFSTIPAFFIDNAQLLHGSSSVTETGGGLGGMVRLATIPDAGEGFNAQYVQGIGSFSTFDEFLRFGYGNEKWQISTRALYSSSPNDYEYTNHDIKKNIYDSDGNIIGQYHPKEKNRNGSFKDLHVLQEAYYNTLHGDRFGLSAWYFNSNRELPLITTDYSDVSKIENRQKESTFRGIVSWSRIRSGWKTGVRAGYLHTGMDYDYKRDAGAGVLSPITASRSRVNTVYAQGEGEYTPSRNWFLTANLSFYHHMVESRDLYPAATADGRMIYGYDKCRPELSAAISAKWQPYDRIGVSAVIREEMNGRTWAAPIPALYIDYILWRPANITAKASVTRNYRFPSLNDLYFLPGGNPSLKNESGVSYDAGLNFTAGKSSVFSTSGSVTWFDSYIDNWIIWLPTAKGFFSPRNIRRVHSYGVEVKVDMALVPHKDWFVDISGSYSWTPSINHGDKVSEADRSVGKQLPYVPLHSASIAGRVTWRGWALGYKWCFYSRRHTMSSNDITITGSLPAYLMNNASLEKHLDFKPVGLQLKLNINNLFNEDYVSVLSRPMPGINFEFFIGITPKFTCNDKNDEINY
ncbi:TonB-dependent receptor [Muribaculum intestinale]|uniref:TonB-dependent receptor n=1 Tax=Muribaculum intestinale TaxID=1796646 RepID=UPI00397BA67F